MSWHDLRNLPTKLQLKTSNGRQDSKTSKVTQLVFSLAVTQRMTNLERMLGTHHFPTLR